MRQVKGIKLEEVVKILFATKIVAHNEYICERLAGTAEAYDKDCAELVTKLHSASLHKALEDICADLEQFLRTLYHEHPPAEQVAADGEETTPKKPKERPRASKRGPRSQVSGKPTSQFVSLLSEGPKRRHREDDTDADMGELPRKNRKGQRARRADWERLYGGEARHLREPPLDHVQASHIPKKEIEQQVKSSKRSKPVEEKKDLHPSWEAKRKQREMLQKAASGDRVNQRIKFTVDDE